MLECQGVTLLNHKIARRQSLVIIILMRCQKVFVTVIPDIKFSIIGHLWSLLYLE